MAGYLAPLLAHIGRAVAASDNSGILAFCAVAALAISGGLAIYTVSKDRADRADRSTKQAAKHHDEDMGDVAAIRRDLNRFMLMMIGRPGDASIGAPKVNGWVDDFAAEVRAHNVEVDARFSEVTEELIATNGGGTLKGQMSRLITDVAALRDQVTALSEEPV